MRRILIIKTSSLGDIFHALPTVHLLKERLGCEVDWVANDLYADLVRCFTEVRRVIPFPRGRIPGGLGEFRKALREEEYDLVIDLQGLLKSALIARMARAGRRIGPSFQREGARFFYDEIAGKRDKNRHAIQECLDVVRHLGLADAPIVFPVSFPAVTPTGARPRIALLPCSRQTRKNWDPVRFAEVARALHKECHAAIQLIGSPADRSVCDFIAREAGCPVENLAGQTSIPQLGGVLATMDLLVTVDSGPMHMAAAVGTPVVAIFGPTYPERTGPFGPEHIILRKKGDISAILPADVIDAARNLMQRRRA